MQTFLLWDFGFFEAFFGLFYLELEFKFNIFFCFLVVFWVMLPAMPLEKQIGVFCG